MAYFVPPVPQPRYSDVLFDGEQIAGIGDALVEGMDRRRQHKRESDIRQAFSGGIPKRADGSPDYMAMANNVMGIDPDVGLTITRLAETQSQNDFMRNKPIAFGDRLLNPNDYSTVAEEPPKPPPDFDLSAGESRYSGQTGEVIAERPAAPPKPTERDLRNQQLATVVAPELQVVEKNFGELAEIGNQAGANAPYVGNWLVSPGYQQARNSVQTIVASYLYSVSGATANPGEIATQTEILMPKAGDDKATVANKLARIRTMANSISNGGDLIAGPATPEEEAPPPGMNESLDLTEGTIIENDAGERLIMQSGEWVPMQ